MSSVRGHRHKVGGFETPITILQQTLSTLTAEDWELKITALETFGSTLPSQQMNSVSEDNLEGGDDCELNNMMNDQDSVGQESTASTISTKQTQTKDQYLTRSGVSGIPFGRSSGGASIPRPTVSTRHLNGSSSSRSLPSNNRGHHTSAHALTENNKVWYLDPTELRHLYLPFQELLTDLRAQLVKSATATLSELSACSRDNLRLLVRDLLPDLIGLHGQTVRTIHGYGMAAMLRILGNVKTRTPGKMGFVPTLLEGSRSHKSKAARKACVRYLRCILEEWPVGFLTIGDITEIGRNLGKSMSDPAQLVREEARGVFEGGKRGVLRRKYHKVWELLMNDESLVDRRMHRTLMATCTGPAGADHEEPRKAKPRLKLTVETKILNAFQNHSANSTPTSHIPPTSSVMIPRVSRPRMQSPRERSNLQKQTKPIGPHGWTSRPSKRDAEPKARARGGFGYKQPSKPPPPPTHKFRSPTANSNTAYDTSFDTTLTASSVKNNPFQLSPMHTSNPGAAKRSLFGKKATARAPPTPTSKVVETEAAVSIQAAIRGVVTRKSILLSLQDTDTHTPVNAEGNNYGEDQDSHGVTSSGQSSDELQMLNQLRSKLALNQRASIESSTSTPSLSALPVPPANAKPPPPPKLMGQTAKAMADRRKSNFDVLPNPRTPAQKRHVGLDAAEEEEEPHERLRTSVSEDAFAATEMLSQMELEDCKPTTSSSLPPSSPKMESPEEEPLVTPHNTNKSTLQTISTQQQPQIQPSSLQVPPPPHPLPLPPSGRTPPPPSGRSPLQRQCSRRQSSIALKERIQRARQESWEEDPTTTTTNTATHDASTTNTNNTTPDTNTTTLSSPGAKSCASSTPPEHIFVGTDILTAHKHHIDELMETLRTEMDVVQKFEQIHLRSSEDEVLEYFESMAVCLDQRVEACDELRRVMDRISRGAPPDGGEG